MLDKKLQTLSKIINDLIEVPLFKEFPSDELQSLVWAVSDEDSLRARVADLCNILDRINKKALDHFSGVSTKGSRDCLICLIKKILPDEHVKIDQMIDSPIGMILLFRGYITHRKNRGIKKALDFFDIDLPIVDFKGTWEKLYFHFNESIDNCIEMLNTVATKINFKQNEIDDQLKNILEERTIRKCSYLLEEPNVKGILLYVMAEGSVIDSDLSKLFKLEMTDLRKTLLPLVPNILKVSYHNSVNTIISVNNYALDMLKEFYL